MRYIFFSVAPVNGFICVAFLCSVLFFFLLYIADPIAKSKWIGDRGDSGSRPQESCVRPHAELQLSASCSSSWSGSARLGPGEALRDRHKGEVCTAPKLHAHFGRKFVKNTKRLPSNPRPSPPQPPPPPPPSFFVLPCGRIINQEGPLQTGAYQTYSLLCVRSGHKIVLHFGAVEARCFSDRV